MAERMRRIASTRLASRCARFDGRENDGLVLLPGRGVDLARRVARDPKRHDVGKSGERLESRERVSSDAVRLLCLQVAVEGLEESSARVFEHSSFRTNLVSVALRPDRFEAGDSDVLDGAPFCEDGPSAGKRGGGRRRCSPSSMSDVRYTGRSNGQSKSNLRSFESYTADANLRRKFSVLAQSKGTREVILTPPRCSRFRRTCRETCAQRRETVRRATKRKGDKTLRRASHLPDLVEAFPLVLLLGCPLHASHFDSLASLAKLKVVSRAPMTQEFEATVSS